MDVDYYGPLADDQVPVAAPTTMLRPPPSYSVAVRSLSSPLLTERAAANTSSNGSQGGRVNVSHHSNHHHHRYYQLNWDCIILGSSNKTEFYGIRLCFVNTKFMIYG
jgi:hypothetical protein